MSVTYRVLCESAVISFNCATRLIISPRFKEELQTSSALFRSYCASLEYDLSTILVSKSFFQVLRFVHVDNGLFSVVVGHGSQSMLGRVVGRAQLQQAFVLCGSQGMTNFNFKKAENRHIRHFVRLRFPSHRYLTSND